MIHDCRRFRGAQTALHRYCRSFSVKGNPLRFITVSGTLPPYHVVDIVWLMFLSVLSLYFRIANSTTQLFVGCLFRQLPFGQLPVIPLRSLYCYLSASQLYLFSFQHHPVLFSKNVQQNNDAFFTAFFVKNSGQSRK